MKTIPEPGTATLEPITEPDVFALVPIRVEEIARAEEADEARRKAVREVPVRRFDLD